VKLQIKVTQEKQERRQIQVMHTLSFSVEF